MGNLDIETAFVNGKLNIKEAIETEPPELDFVLPGLLKGTVGGLVATGSTGKSFLALQLCVQLATLNKIDFFKIPFPNSPTHNKHYIYTTYITAEDPITILQHRIHNIGRLLKPEYRQSVYESCDIQSWFGLSPYLLDKDLKRNNEWIDAIKRGLAFTDLCFFDTLSLFHSAIENDNDSMKFVIDVFK